MCPLVTGGKHYFGSFEESGNYEVVSPYREEQARKPGLNFYYTQEDILFERARSQGFKWNVHRPQTIVGYALGNAMNMGVTLAVYATICKETGRPFVFPGSPTLHNGINDVNRCANTCEPLALGRDYAGWGKSSIQHYQRRRFRWNWMWKQIADFFELEVAPYPGHANPLEEQMRESSPVWDKIVAKHSLKENKMENLVSWWHTDSDLSRNFEPFADMSKSRSFGFLEYRKASESFFDLFKRLKADRIIP